MRKKREFEVKVKVKDIKPGVIVDIGDGELIEVLEVYNWKRCKIKFLDDHGYTKEADKGAIRYGFIKNPYAPIVSGVGFVGDGKYSYSNSKKAHRHWTSMLERCYNKEHPAYNRYGGRGVYVHEQFLNFQLFAGWCESQRGFEEEGWQLDKDILLPFNLVYGPDTCCFVPSEINIAFVSSTKDKRDNLPVGVIDGGHEGRKYRAACNGMKLGNHYTVVDAFKAYKRHKEDYIKTLAERHKDGLSDRVYSRLMTFEVDPVVPTMDWKLDIVSQEHFTKLQQTGKLHCLYPECPLSWAECKDFKKKYDYYEANKESNYAASLKITEEEEKHVRSSN